MKSISLKLTRTHCPYTKLFMGQLPLEVVEY